MSIVRDNQPRPDQFDVAVPRYSQNMNNVFALHGVSEVVAVKGEHFTGVADGYALARLLAQLRVFGFRFLYTTKTLKMFRYHKLNCGDVLGWFIDGDQR